MARSDAPHGAALDHGEPLQNPWFLTLCCTVLGQVTVVVTA
jgi:hypothetical protein